MRPSFSWAMHVSAYDSAILQDRPHFGYQTFVTETNITASSTAAWYDVASLANSITTERFKPNAVPFNINVDCGEIVDVNYFGVASHTLGTYGCNVLAYYSNDGVTYTKIDDVLPSDNRAIMFCFDTISARYFRLRVTGGSGTPTLAILQIGKLLTMPLKIYGGHTPITLARKTKIIRNKTEGGQFAGASIINEGVSTNVSFRLLQADWYREFFDPFVLHARTKPFFFTWYNSKFEREAGFCWTNNDITPTNSGMRDFMNVDLTMEGFSDE